VWIGCNAVIMEGVKVGNGAVVGAGAIVTKDVKPYEIVVGIPAKHLRYRFDKEIIDNIEKSKWWEKEDMFYRNNDKLFKSKITLDMSEKLRIISGGLE
jgi:serine acetyltransferase